MKVWVMLEPPGALCQVSLYRPLTFRDGGVRREEVRGAEGKVLADRAPLQKALIEQDAGYRWCRWPDCGQTSMHGEETVPHAATCPLYLEAADAS